jgi:hypothetical protein
MRYFIIGGLLTLAAYLVYRKIKSESSQAEWWERA